MEQLEFLQEIYSGCDAGFLTVWTKQDKRTQWFLLSEIKEIVEYANKQNIDKDVYFGVGLRKKNLGSFQRGENNDIIALPCLWIDIDILGEGHSQKELPKTLEEALSLVDVIGLKPSITVFTGGGIHCYWLFKNPVIIATSSHFENISNTLKGFQKCIIESSLEKGFKLDNTSDLARVLRLPDTINHKNQTRAKVIQNNNIRYSPTDFSRFKLPSKAIEVSNGNGERQSMKGIITGSGKRIIENCIFMQYCRDNAKKLPEPYWHACITNIALAKDGRELCHEISKPYDKYNELETEYKINRAISEHKPHTCKYIKESLRFEGCNNDCKVKAPIVLTIITKEEQVLEVLEREIQDYKVVFDKEYVEALVYAKYKMPSEFAKFKTKIKGKVNLRDLENCIKLSKKDALAIQFDPVPLELDGINLTGINAPKDWKVSIENGVKRTITQGDNIRTVIASPVAVVISKRLRNIDNDTEKLEISFYRDNHWRSFVGHRSDIFSRSGIMKFGDTGLPVTTGTAPDLVEYFADFENANLNTIPCQNSISRVGWISDTEFYPFTQNDASIEFEPDSQEAMVIYKALTKNGDYGLWLEEIKKYREVNTFARFLLATSFATPLLEKVKHRVFFVHFWHDSKSGKTALLKAALSIWGDPMKLISSFNATQIGLERKAEALDTLPFAIDELQALNEKRVPASSIVYNLGNGFGKLRGSKSGGLQKLAEWRTIVITTGEQPISNESSMDGIQSRVLEVYAKMVDNEKDGTKLHQFVEHNYGNAGCAYMRFLSDMIINNNKKIESDYERFNLALEQRFGVSGYNTCVSLICLGDYYASIGLWAESQSIAFENAVLMGVKVLNNNKELLHEDSVFRAWEFVNGWLISNSNRFNPDSTPCYGKIDNNGDYLVFPQYLYEALESAGFNITKTIKGFENKNYLVPNPSGKNNYRNKWRTRIGSLRSWLFKFSLEKDFDAAQPLSPNKP